MRADYGVYGGAIPMQVSYYNYPFLSFPFPETMIYQSKTRAMKKMIFFLLFLPFCLYSQKTSNYAYIVYSNEGGYEN